MRLFQIRCMMPGEVYGQASKVLSDESKGCMCEWISVLKQSHSSFLMNPEIYIQLMVHNFNDDSDDSVEFEEFEQFEDTKLV